jgi:AcrR family transcriptional regulator
VSECSLIYAHGVTPRAPALPPDQRRAALVRATLPLLRAHGGDVSTREIAAAAGVAEGTIFRVFDSKEDLVHACIHAAFDTDVVCAGLREIDRALPLAERLTQAVALLQQHLEGVFALMMSLRSAGQPVGRRPPKVEHSREQANERVDAEMTALVGADAHRLRLPPQRLLDYLRMLTLASVHPMMQLRAAGPAEIVDVVLHGLLAASDTAPPPPTTARGA